MSSDSALSLPQFSSRYELQERIGKGGMGVVYRAYDNVLKKTVAVKLLLPTLKNEAKMRFQNEARMAAMLEHSNILKVLDFGVTSKGELFLIMDFIEGVTLDSLVRKNGPLDIELSVDIFCQICSALQHAHNHGVLHRDVKPSNIILQRQSDSSFLAKVVDFGIAKLTSDEQRLTATGARVGSPLYMSPEQARGEEVDERSDVYSMGCLMFFCLSGATPFQGDSYMEIITKQIEETAPKLNSVSESRQFPTSLEDMVAKALNKDPLQRYSKIGDLAEALATFAQELRAPEASPQSSRMPLHVVPMKQI